MALQALNSQYWAGDGLVNAAPPPTLTQYPAWQVVALTASCLLLCLSGTYVHLAFLPFVRAPRIPKTWKQKLMSWVRRLPLWVRLTYHAIRLVWSKDFKRADEAVRLVSIAKGMHNGQAWGAIGQRMGEQPGVGENIYRHLAAAQEYGPETIRTRHRRNVLLELAHYGLKEL